MKRWNVGSLVGLAMTSGLVLSACGPADELAQEPQQPQTAEQELYAGNLGSAVGNAVASGSTCGVSNDFQPSCGSSSGTGDRAYTWTAPYTGTFTFTTAGSSFDTILEVRRYSDSVSLACNDDANGTLQSSVGVSLTAGQTVLVVVDGFGTACGNTQVNIQPPATGVDLVVTGITRDSTYYYLTYCNVGGSTSSQTFTFNTTNVNTGQSFESNYLYPYSVPAPGTCLRTGGLTCGLIGDPNCNQAIQVRGQVDWRGTVTETNEANNTYTVQF